MSALVTYTADDADGVRRVLAVIRDSRGDLRAVPDEAQHRRKVAAATNKDSMEALLASEGVAH